MKVRSLLIALILTACAAAPTAREAPIPPRTLAEVPTDAPGQFGACPGGLQVAMVQWRVGERVYRILVAPTTGRWALIGPGEGRVWHGTLGDDGTLTVTGTLTLEEAKARFPDPCILLEEPI